MRKFQTSKPVRLLADFKLLKWIKQFLRWLHHLILHYKRKRVNRQAEIVPLKEATTVALLFNAIDQDVIQQVSRFVDSLKEQGKDVEVLAYIPLYKGTPFVRFDSFSKKDVNFLQIPKQKAVGKYLDTRYDLLINFSLEECLPLEYIAALSPATYKVGRYQQDKTYCYDFMINLDEEHANTGYFIKQSEHYLNLFSHEARAI